MPCDCFASNPWFCLQDSLSLEKGSDPYDFNRGGLSAAGARKIATSCQAGFCVQATMWAAKRVDFQHLSARTSIMSVVQPGDSTFKDYGHWSCGLSASASGCSFKLKPSKMPRSRFASCTCCVRKTTAPQAVTLTLIHGTEM